MGIGHLRTPWENVQGSGRVNERFVFGAVRVSDPAYDRDRQRLIQQFRAQRSVVPFSAGLELVKRFQPLHPDGGGPVDPENPTKQFPNAVRNYVLQRLKDGSKVFFWTTVGSFMDQDLGADAVFEVIVGEKKYLIPLDVTIYSGEQSHNPHHLSNLIVVRGEIPDAGLEKDKFNEKVQRVGGEILAKISVFPKTP